MKVLNILFVSCYAIVCSGIQAMEITYDNDAFEKRKLTETPSLSLKEFLAKPSYVDKDGKAYPIILNNELKTQLSAAINDKKNETAMHKKLQNAIQIVSIYDISDNVESISFELYDNKIIVSGNAPI